MLTAPTFASAFAANVHAGRKPAGEVRPEAQPNLADAEDESAKTNAKAKRPAAARKTPAPPQTPADGAHARRDATPL